MDLPAHTIDEALRVPKAIADNYAFEPTRPLAVADAMGMKPTTGKFRSLCGASIAFGLTDGGYNASEISLTELGKRVVAPTVEGDEIIAKREAAMNPRILSEFFNRYDGAKLPPDNILYNVLAEMGIQRTVTAKALKLLILCAQSVGFLRDIRGTMYVDLAGTSVSPTQGIVDDEEDMVGDDGNFASETLVDTKPVQGVYQPVDKQSSPNRKVFITHGKNRAFIDPIKQLLAFGDFEPVVATEQESVSKPVPEKVLDEMRQCGAAIIHVDAEQKLTDAEGSEHIVLNPNVLLEIGAAMALYSRRFILLVREGVSLPSNLQGLYEVRYQGPKLDSDATIKLMKTINELKRMRS